MELDTRLGLDRSIMEAFVLAVQSRMLENPYHNWIHACDVAQASSPLHSPRLPSCLSMLLVWNLRHFLAVCK